MHQCKKLIVHPFYEITGYGDLKIHLQVVKSKKNI